MKTIVIILLITLSFAFVPEPSFLETKPQDLTLSIPDIAQEIDIQVPIEEAPRLQRQNAMRFPSSDSEDSTDLETSDSDSFQVDQTYFYGLNSSFTDLYNEWNKESLQNENEKEDDVQKETVKKDLINKSFDRIENVFEDIFDEVIVVLKELSKEAEEKNTISGIDKSSFKELLKSPKEEFAKAFDLISLVVGQITNQPNLDKTLFGLDKDTILKGFSELEENADEIFDETLMTLMELAKEGTEKNTLFGLGKGDIKKIFGQAEENFEKMINEISLQFVDLLNQDVRTEESSCSDLSSDETDVDHTYFNGLDSTSGSSSEGELDEVLLAIRNLFNETVEEKALFNTKSNSEEADTFDVDHTYFNGLDGSALDQDSASQPEDNIEVVDFEKVFQALSGLVTEVIEREKLLE